MALDNCPEPFTHVAGPHDAQVVVIGEAHGESEERCGLPFAGQSGRELARMFIETGWDVEGLLLAAVNAQRDSEWLSLREEWLHVASIMLTNVFSLRPISNNLGYLCASKSELSTSYDLPPVRTENPRYVREEYLPHLQRLAGELTLCPRKLIICLGATACWAMMGSSAISKLRGAVTSAGRLAPIAFGQTQWLPAWKCLPTYHPAAILRAWNWRVIVLADLIKAKREREFAEIRRPERSIIVNPTLDEILAWSAQTLWGFRQDKRYSLLSPDIETMNGQIRCIGFARSRNEALVIPFIADVSGKSYWPDEQQELMAWAAVRDLLESDIPKVFQNGMFDLLYLTRAGINTRNCRHDTMLLHHSKYPEMQKSLGFLGSVYTNESSWKLMRLHKGEEQLKRDE